jgi:hypothetical protein
MTETPLPHLQPSPALVTQAPAPGSRPLRYTAILLVAAILSASGVLALNYTVDPRNTFPPDLYKPVWRDTYEDRLRAHDGATPVPDIVVFGSSTSRRLTPDAFPAPQNRTAFNLAAPGSGPEDYLPIYRYLERTGRAPHEIVVGVDDFMMLDVPWNGAILPASHANARVTGNGTTWAYYADQLVSSYNPGYVLDSLRVLQYTYLTGYPAARPVGQEAARATGLGDLVGDGVQGIFSGQYKPEVRFDPAKVTALQELVHEASVRGAVRLIVPPIHPDVLKLFNGTADYERIHGQVLSTLLALCSPTVHVHDFLQLGSFGGDPAAFDDAWHYSLANGQAMLHTAYAQDPDACAAHR